MSQTVSVKIQINDGGTFKDITVNVEELAKAFNSVKSKASELEKSFVNMVPVTQHTGLSNSISVWHTTSCIFSATSSFVTEICGIGVWK